MILRIRRMLIGLIIYLLFLLIIYLIHINFYKVDVILYSSLVDVVLATIAFGLLINVIELFSIFTIFEKSQILISSFLLGTICALSFPTIIDRSLSFYILEKIKYENAGIKLESLDLVIKNEYLDEYRVSSVRLTEQIASKTIKIENGCIRLTEKGRLIANISSLVRTNLLAKHRLLKNQYTDALNDPFKFGKSNNEYLC